ncbi:MAG: CBS domain-containing protein [Nitrospinota bacterium]
MTVRVKDLMVADVVTIDGMAPLKEAIDLMFEKSVKALIIPPRKETDTFSILTFTDIAKKVAAGEEQIDMLNVYDLMSKPCYGVNGDMDIKHAATMMTKLNISRIIVVEDKKLIGIISITDLVKSLIKR